MDTGIYRIASFQSSSQVMNVASGSKANSANVEIYKNNEAYNQRRWYVYKYGDYYVIRNVNSNKVLHVHAHKAKNSQNVKQFSWEKGSWQQWSIANSTTVTINGQTYTSVYLKTRLNKKYALDRKGGKYSNSTNVHIYKYHGGNAQKWVFIKDTRYQKTSVPTNVGLADSTTGKAYVNKACFATTSTFYPAWNCSAGEYWQIRWRWRGRKTGTNNWSGWTRWYVNSNNSAIDDKSFDDEGWGNAWTYSVRDKGSNTLYHSTQGIKVNVNQETYDKKELQLEVRRFLPNNAKLNGVKISSHGGSCTQTIKCIFKPTITCGEISFTPDGLVVPINSDFRRNGNSVTIKSIKIGGKTLVSNFKKDNFKYTGDTIEVPMSQLKFIPEHGADVRMSIQFGTIDYSWTYNLNTSITYSSNHGISINPSFASAPGWMELALVGGNYTEKRCWLLVDNDGRTYYSECEKNSDGDFIIVPPLGREYTLFFTAESSAGWGTYQVVRPPIETCKHVIFNYDDQYAILPWNAKMDWSLNRDTEIVQTQGRNFESVFFGKGSSRQMTISGDLLLDDYVENSDFTDFDKLSVCNYAVVRFPYGERFDVAIEKVAFSAEHSQYRSVTVTCREVS